jgi:hypothetical protein
MNATMSTACEVLRVHHQYMTLHSIGILWQKKTYINNPRLECSEKKIIFVMSLPDFAVIVNHPSKLHPREVG